MMRSCPECKQTLPPIAGSIQTYKESETRIIDIVRRAGSGGIQSFDLLQLMFPDGTPNGDTKAIRDRIFHLNKKLRRDGKRIWAGSSSGGYGDYRFEDIKRREPVPMLQPAEANASP